MALELLIWILEWLVIFVLESRLKKERHNVSKRRVFISLILKRGRK